MIKLRLTIDLAVHDIAEVGDIESEQTLHSLARSYFIHQYGDASEYMHDSGLDVFEAACLDTLTGDGIGEFAAELGNPFTVLDSHITEVEPS